ncbi:N-acetylglucosamine kinase [Phytohabitans kaempferiae]|uniref:N-acetylglucosamine kinase n=1 Tax=Phytohabitans kaempferiae TaxID=1620943 RepID=A0ABV6MCK7_9ACTN
MSPHDIVIDAGQTGLRLGVAARGAILTRAPERAGPSYLDGGAADSVLRAVRAAASALPASGGAVSTVCIGLATVLTSPGAYGELAATLRDDFGAARAMVTGDVVTAHAGALTGRPGVVLAAGTGAIALGITAAGRHRRVDGWGYLLGDAGGGSWIGRRGLDAAVRGHDGRMGAGALTASAEQTFGDLATLPERLYGAPDAVRQIAGFARSVLRLAAEGEPHATAIVAEAGTELARTAAAAAADFDPGDGVGVSWTGGLLADAGLREAFLGGLSRLRPDAVPLPPAGDGLAGAALLAADPGGYTGLLQALVQ